MSRDFGTRMRIGGYLNTRAEIPDRNYSLRKKNAKSDFLENLSDSSDVG